MIKYLSESTPLLQFISTLLSPVNPIVSCWQEKKKKEYKWKLGYLWDFSPPWRNKSKKKRKKKSPTILKVKSNCIWQIIKRKNVFYYQTTVMDWFPFVSLQIQLNFFFQRSCFFLPGSGQNLAGIKSILYKSTFRTAEIRELWTELLWTVLGHLRWKIHLFWWWNAATGMFLYLLLHYGKCSKSSTQDT